MTSLEGSEYRGRHRPERRSGGVSFCPRVTVNHPCPPFDRARDGHGARLIRLGLIQAPHLGTISLGIWAVRASILADLRCEVSATNPGIPLVAGANCTIIARTLG